MTRTKSLFLTLAIVMLVATAGVAPESANCRADLPSPDQDTIIIVGLQPGMNHLVINGRLHQPREGAEDLGAIGKLGKLIEPVFDRDVRELRSEYRRARAAHAAASPDLSRWLRVTLRDGVDPATALATLQANPAVDTAYIKPQAFPASTGAEASAIYTPDFTDSQGYLKNSPDGLGVEYAWSVPGGTGKKVTVADVEGDWQKRHTDLNLAKKRINGARAGKNSSWYPHGTAVMGIIGGKKNGFGITGIAYQSSQRMYSIFRKNDRGQLDDNVASAIDRAASALKRGDIMLIEVMYSGIKSSAAYIPVEYYEDVFEAIQAAAAKGIIVVEAAANGGQNLDSDLYENRFNPEVRGDSGAIMVGAGSPPEPIPASDRKRLGFSNYGIRVNVQNWGRYVVSTGYGDLWYGWKSDRRDYTSTFNGTSSASALTAGVCASLQGAALEILGRPLTPGEMRKVLIDTGSPQQGKTDKQHIGPRPDLKAAIEAVELMADSAGNSVN